MLIGSVFAFATLAQATPVSSTVITIASPKVGQSPAVNRFAASETPCYRMAWRTLLVNGTEVNYLTYFGYKKDNLFIADNVFGATTYAEMQAKATALGITNLPADPQAGH